MIYFKKQGLLKRDPDEELFDEVVLRRLKKEVERLCSGARHVYRYGGQRYAACLEGAVGRGRGP